MNLQSLFNRRTITVGALACMAALLGSLVWDHLHPAEASDHATALAAPAQAAARATTPGSGTPGGLSHAAADGAPGTPLRLARHLDLRTLAGVSATKAAAIPGDVASGGAPAVAGPLAAGQGTASEVSAWVESPEQVAAPGAGADPAPKGEAGAPGSVVAQTVAGGMLDGGVLLRGGGGATAAGVAVVAAAPPAASPTSTPVAQTVSAPAGGQGEAPLVHPQVGLSRRVVAATAPAVPLVTAVPEPGTYLLMVVGFVVLAMRRARKRQKLL